MTWILGKEFHEPDFGKKTISSEYFHEIGLTECDDKNTEVLSLPSDEFHHNPQKNFPDRYFVLPASVIFCEYLRRCSP